MISNLQMRRCLFFAAPPNLRTAASRQTTFLIVTLAFRNQRKPLKTQADHEF